MTHGRAATIVEQKKPRMRKCKCCGERFSPRSTWHIACSQECAAKVVREKREKEERKAAVKQLRERKQKLKTRSDYIREAQAAFNAFIRARDADKPCICCGQWGQDEGWKPGGSWDAGHYLGVGAYPELRFVEDNCHKQLKSCNAGSGKYARKGRTVAQEYRERLIQKIGIERVEFLEGHHEPRKWSIAELVEIKREFVAKRKAIEAQREEVAA